VSGVVCRAFPRFCMADADMRGEVDVIEPVVMIQNVHDGIFALRAVPNGNASSFHLSLSRKETQMSGHWMWILIIVLVVVVIVVAL
jgi:hypothetical protein